MTTAELVPVSTIPSRIATRIGYPRTSIAITAVTATVRNAMRLDDNMARMEGPLSPPKGKLRPPSNRMSAMESPMI